MTTMRIVSMVTALVIVVSTTLIASASGAIESLADRRGVPSDVPYIRCETCEYIARAAVNETNKLDQSALTELRLFDLVEQLCDPSTTEGTWARTIDLVERVRKLHMEAQPTAQTCKQECRTISLACKKVLDGVETEFAEQLYAWRKQGQVQQLQVSKWLCDKREGVSGACAQRTPMFSKDRPVGPEFKPADEKEELEMKMKEFAAKSGQNMNMFNREDMMKNMGGMGGMGGDGDDDDDDDDDDEVGDGDGDDDNGGDEDDDDDDDEEEEEDSKEEL